MSDVYEYMASVVQVIREDGQLRDSFNKILGAAHSDERVPLLLAELAEIGAPETVTRFVSLLSDDAVAAVVLQEINK